MRITLRHINALSRLVLIAALIVISYLALTPKSYPLIETISDKFKHMLAFLVLGWLCDISFPKSPFSFAKIGFLLGYGLFLELWQHYLPYREFSMLDMLADSLGLFLYRILRPLMMRCPLFKWQWKDTQ
jgi:VanZ family protein